MIQATYAAVLARLEEHAPNIDGWSVDADDVSQLAQCLQRQSRHAGRIMFPGRPAGYVTATRNLAHYAWNKATAMQCRERGDVSGASLYEKICQDIYDRLPGFARW